MSLVLCLLPHDIIILNRFFFISDEDVIVLTDAYDVLFLEPAIEILERYKAFCAPIVFSAETRCHPDTGMIML